MNFLEAYRDYTKESEAPTAYHVWSAISTVSAVLSKRTCIRMALFTFYPNLFVVLVGEPAMAKTTAMSVAKKLLRTIDNFPLAAESITREALIDTLAENKLEFKFKGKTYEYHACTAFVSEMSEFLGGDHTSGNSVSFLTELWDTPSFEARTRKGGSIKLPSPFFSLLGCCQPDYITTKMKEMIIGGGFARRVLFIFEDQLQCINPWPERTVRQDECEEVMRKEVQRMRAITGPYVLTRQARENWDKWYRENKKLAVSAEPKLRGYYGSKPELALKTSMCLAACYSSGRIVNSEVLRRAIALLDYSEPKLTKVFGGIGRNQLKPIQDKIYEAIEKHGPKGCSMYALYADFVHSANQKEFAEIVQNLVNTRKITQTAQGVAGAVIDYLLTATSATAPAQAKALFDLIAQSPSNEEDLAVTSAEVESQCHFDPELERLAQLRVSKLTDLARGVLIRGMRPETP